MKWSVLWDLSVHNTSPPFDHTCCLDKTELDTCLRFPMSRSRNRKLQSEVFLSSSSNVSIRCCLPTPRAATQAAHHFLKSSSSCSDLLIRFFGFISTVGISAFQGFFIFFIISHLDICTRFTNWFGVITSGCCFSIQSFRWTYERAALPYSFPDC